jgi:hypothetical protein
MLPHNPKTLLVFSISWVRDLKQRNFLLAPWSGINSDPDGMAAFVLIQGSNNMFLFYFLARLCVYKYIFHIAFAQHMYVSKTEIAA